MSMSSHSTTQQKSNSNNSSISKSKNKNINLSTVNHPPLYKKHLQPSSPPTSIGKKQLKLFQKVLNRRITQLHEFPTERHQSLYEYLTITALENTVADGGDSTSNPTSNSTRNSTSKEVPITSKEINNLFQKLPTKRPRNIDNYISLFEYLLTENFYSSSDNRLQTTIRSHCLQKVKYILFCIDEVYRVHLGELKKEKESSPQQQQQQQQKQTAVQSNSMGTVSSKSISNSNSIQDKEVIVLDDDDDDGEDLHQERDLAIQPQTSKLAVKKPQDNDDQVVVSTKASGKSKESLQKLQLEQLKSAYEEVSEQKRETTLSSATEPIKPKFKPSSKIPPSQKYIPSYVTTKPSLYLNTPFKNQTNIATFTFLPDSKYGNFTTSNSLSEYSRSRCEISINTSFESCNSTIERIKSTPIPPPHAASIPNSSIFLDGPALDDLNTRLCKWDPYWRVICNCSTFYSHTQNGQGPHTLVGYKTTNIVNQRMDYPMNTRNANFALARTSCVVPIQLKNLFTSKHIRNIVCNKVAWGASRASHSTSYNNVRYADKEVRMIVRALPLVPNPKYAKIRSDTHQWPKGTFFQLDSKIIQIFAQRKQQQHDHKLWKGLSAVLDLTEHLSIQNMSTRFNQNIPMNLALMCKDAEMYGIQIALCEYISHEALYKICMSSGTQGSIAKMNYEDGLNHAMKHFEKETLVLDSDSEDEGIKNKKKDSSSEIRHLTCSLQCPVSMQTIKTPVRGKNCKHLNCFDLQTYLESNSKVSGGRWRCFVCEDFIPVEDLVYDGFIAQVLETHKDDISATRDKMQLSSDGTWGLVDQTETSSMKRNNKKRKMKENNDSLKKIARQVIDIDD